MVNIIPLVHTSKNMPKFNELQIKQYEWDSKIMKDATNW